MNEKKYYINEEGRCVALRDFGDVKKSDVGGFVENESNLSHQGNCWVYDNARVYGMSWVYDDAVVRGNAVVGEDAVVRGNAVVEENSWVGGNAWVLGSAQVGKDAWVGEDAWVGGNAVVGGNARVDGDAQVYGDAQIVFAIKSINDFICLGFFGNHKRTVTINLVEKKIVCGCFYDTFDEFEKAVDEKYNGVGNYYNLIKILKTL